MAERWIGLIIYEVKLWTLKFFDKFSRLFRRIYTIKNSLRKLLNSFNPLNILYRLWNRQKIKKNYLTITLILFSIIFSFLCGFIAAKFVFLRTFGLQHAFEITETTNILHISMVTLRISYIRANVILKSTLNLCYIVSRVFPLLPI